MTAIDLFANNAVTTITANLTSSQTSLSVSSSTGFPSLGLGGHQFRIAIDKELMIVTAMSGTTWTVTRGAEGSTAATHTSGASVFCVLTAASVQAVQYPTSTPELLADNAGQLYYSTGSVLADTYGDLLYSLGSTLADNGGNLYYGNGTQLADVYGDLILPGAGTASVIDGNGVEGHAGDVLTSLGTVGSAVWTSPTSIFTPVNVTGSRSSGAALTNLLTALASQGIITNSTTT